MKEEDREPKLTDIYTSQYVFHQHPSGRHHYGRHRRCRPGWP